MDISCDFLAKVRKEIFTRFFEEPRLAKDKREDSLLHIEQKYAKEGLWEQNTGDLISDQSQWTKELFLTEKIELKRRNFSRERFLHLLAIGDTLDERTQPEETPSHRVEVVVQTNKRPSRLKNKMKMALIRGSHNVKKSADELHRIYSQKKAYKQREIDSTSYKKDYDHFSKVQQTNKRYERRGNNQ